MTARKDAHSWRGRSGPSGRSCGQFTMLMGVPYLWYNPQNRILIFQAPILGSRVHGGNCN